MEEHEERLRELEKSFLHLIEDIDKSHLRKMQGDMHRCAASCCDNLSYSTERNQNCIENCSVTIQNAHQYVQSEISRLQNRWSRCIMECNDRIRDSVTTKESKESSARLTKDFGTCATGCIDTQCNLMRIAKANMERLLASGEYKNVQL